MFSQRGLACLSVWSLPGAALLVSFLASSARAQDPFDVARALPFAHDGSLRVVADLDLDGAPDPILFLSPQVVYDWAGMQTWMNQGNFQFTPGSTVNFDFLGYDDDISRMKPLVGDVTGDGIPDVVMDLFLYPPKIGSGLLVYPGLGNGGFGPPISIPMGIAFSMTLGNIDADPALEIAVFHGDAN